MAKEDLPPLFTVHGKSVRDAGNQRRRSDSNLKYPKPSPPPEAKTLRALTEKFKLTTDEVAYFLDVKPQTARAYLCGVRAIPAARFEKLKRAVGYGR